MAGPGLPLTIDTTYADSGTDASVETHEQHHDLVHTVVNDFDVANVGTAGYVPIGNGTVLVTRALLSTDLPGLVSVTPTVSYTLVVADAGKLTEMNVATANQLTVPPNSSVAIPVGSVINLCQYGAGVTTVAAGSGVTTLSLNGLLALAGRYAEATLRKRATDEWVLSDALA